jgi:general secretion pathway protein D
MPGYRHRPRSRRLSQAASNVVRIAGLSLSVLACSAAGAQTGTQTTPPDASNTPVSTPAGTLAASATKNTPASASRHPVSESQARQADDAYLEGAKQIEHMNLAAAERSFAKAVQLNPDKQEYILSLAVTREQRVTELVQSAAKARLLGDDKHADELLAEAKAIDPENSVVTQHLGVDASPRPRIVEAESLPGRKPSDAFGGPIELEPAAGTKSFHLRGSEQEVIRSVYSTFGITVTFDESFTGSRQVKFDLDDVDFTAATHVLRDLTHVFAVAVQPKAALVAKDTAEDRERLMPLVEETIYLPGISSDEMKELADVARNIFDLKQVTASPTGGTILVRGDESTLRLLNATYADMVDGGSDVQLDIHLYEVDKSHIVNIGAQLPNSAGVFSAATELQSVLNQNQSLINQAVAAGVIKLTGNPSVDIPAELGVLYAAGQLSSISQITGLLGLFGKYAGFPLAGLYLSGSSTFNLALNSSDTRTLDDIKVRASDNQSVNFRSGTRYPITTSTYSSGVSSSLSSSVAGLSVGGTSVSSLLNQYLGTSSVTIPQIQYEDLGISVKAKPRILRTGDVHLDLELKIEALSGGSNDGIPILNSRALTSTVTVPAGQTALLATEVTRNEARSVDGLPGLSELPGFQGTDKDSDLEHDELLITITPHIVRAGMVRVASRRLAVEHTPPAAQ